ncbi:hypothetical protein H5410_031453 [Solanum commersonii]|uniref:Uncharacterized protein n=1 Tax=Solanum commersonii TaxID=4109 RepID=A0A9J5YH73_SOLCO|nr:hypothetical protein H5410_031453 [Solanum commersonii]
MGRPRGLADFFKITKTISEERIKISLEELCTWKSLYDYKVVREITLLPPAISAARCFNGGSSMWVGYGLKEKSGYFNQNWIILVDLGLSIQLRDTIDKFVNGEGKNNFILTVRVKKTNK